MGARSTVVHVRRYRQIFQPVPLTVLGGFSSLCARFQPVTFLRLTRPFVLCIASAQFYDLVCVSFGGSEHALCACRSCASVPRHVCVCFQPVIVPVHLVLGSHRLVLQPVLAFSASYCPRDDPFLVPVYFACSV